MPNKNANQSDDLRNAKEKFDSILEMLHDKYGIKGIHVGGVMTGKKNNFEARNKIKEQIKEQISILDVAEEAGLNIVKVGRYFSIQEYDSIIIYPETNSYYRNSDRVGGTIFEFVKEIPECGHLSFIEAFNKFAPRIDPSIVLTDAQKKEREGKEKVLLNRQERTQLLQSQLKKDVTNKHMLAYLIRTRGIEPSILYDMLNKKVLMQIENEQGYRSMAFLGYDRDGFLVNASQRSCSANSRFMADFEGNDYSVARVYSPVTETFRYGHKLDPSRKLVCGEADIDMMSYATLLDMNGYDYKAYDYLSCGSANKYSSIIETVKEVGYRDIIFAFDNDEAGRRFTFETLNKLLEEYNPEKYDKLKEIISSLKPEEKDARILEFAEKARGDLNEVGFDIKIHIPESKDFNQDLQNIRESKGLKNRIASAKEKNEERGVLKGREVSQER